MRVLNLVTVPASFIYQKTKPIIYIFGIFGIYSAYRLYSPNVDSSNPNLDHCSNQPITTPSNSTFPFPPIDTTVIIPYIAPNNPIKLFTTYVLISVLTFIITRATDFVYKALNLILKIGYQCRLINLQWLESKASLGSTNCMYVLSIIEPDSLFRIFFDSCKNERNYDLVKKLLDYVKDVNQKNNEGNTALHATILHSNNNRIMDLLLKKDGINADIANNQGNTALHLVVKNKLHIFIINLLSSGKININLQNHEGNTALHIAVQTSISFIVNKLFDFGAEIHHLNNERKAAIEYLLPKNQQTTPSPTDRGVIKVCHKEIARLFINKHGDDILNESANHGNRRVFLERYFPEGRSPVNSEPSTLSPSRQPPQTFNSPPRCNNTALRSLASDAHMCSSRKSGFMVGMSSFSSADAPERTQSNGSEDSRSSSEGSTDTTPPFLSGQQEGIHSKSESDSAYGGRYEHSRQNMVNNTGLYHPPQGGERSDSRGAEPSTTYALPAGSASPGNPSSNAKSAASLASTPAISLTGISSQPGAASIDTPASQPSSNTGSRFSTPGRTTSPGKEVNSSTTPGSAFAPWAVQYPSHQASTELNMPISALHLRRCSASLPVSSSSPRTKREDSAISM